MVSSTEFQCYLLITLWRKNVSDTFIWHSIFMTLSLLPSPINAFKILAAIYSSQVKQPGNRIKRQNQDCRRFSTVRSPIFISVKWIYQKSIKIEWDRDRDKERDKEQNYEHMNHYLMIIESIIKAWILLSQTYIYNNIRICFCYALQLNFLQMRCHDDSLKTF